MVMLGFHLHKTELLYVDCVTETIEIIFPHKGNIILDRSA